MQVSGLRAGAGPRERRRLHAEQQGTVATDAETEQPVTMARVTGAELLRSLRAEADRVAGIAERLREAIATVGDPTAAEVELEAMRTAAEQRASTAEARAASAEQRASQADRLRAQADEAAEEMSEHLAAAQARATQAQDAQAEAARQHAAEADRIRGEAQAQVAA